MNIHKSLVFIVSLLMSKSLYAQDSVSVPIDTLGVVEVKSKRIQQRNTGSYLIVTNKIRNKHFNALSMLKEFPSVRYNPINEQIKINGTSGIAFQINGLDKSSEEIKNIPVNAIKGVEIINQVDGLHLVEGVRYVVNIILKEDYHGFDLFARNFLIMSPAGNNGKDIVACEQPSLSMQYRSSRWDVNATAVYGRFDWNYPVLAVKEYDNKIMKSLDYSPSNPNQLTTRNEFAYRIAADYRINNNNIISFNALYNPFKYREKTVNYFKNDNGDDIGILEDIESDTKEHNIKISLGYKTNFFDNWSLGVYSGLNYVFKDNMNCADGTTSVYEQSKKYSFSKLNTQYTGIKKCKLEFGATYISNFYKTSQSLISAKIHSNRYNIYAFGTYNPSDSWCLRVGLAGIGIHSANEKRFNFQPTIKLNFTSPNENLKFDFGYVNTPNYPKLYQLSEATYKTDRVITHQGNPNLKAQTSLHQFSGTIAFHDIALHSEIEYNRNGISNYYYQNSNGNYILSYENARFFSNSTILSYSLDLSSKFNLEAGIGFCHNSVSNNNFHKKSKTRLIGNAVLNYYNEKKAFSVSLEYSKDKQSMCLLQGIKETGQDLCNLTIQKVWLKGRLRGQFIYALPIHWGLSSWQHEQVDAGFYKTKQSLNLKTYDNMFFLRLSYQIHKGKKTRILTDSGIYDDETKQGRNLIGHE